MGLDSKRLKDVILELTTDTNCHRRIIQPFCKITSSEKNPLDDICTMRIANTTDVANIVHLNLTGYHNVTSFHTNSKNI